MSEVVNEDDRPSSATPEGRRGHLRGNLGVPAIVLMVVAAAAPLSTIGGNVPIGMALGDTSGMPVAFLVAGVIFLLFAASFVAMSKYVSDTGAFYAYIQKGLGKAVGTGAAVLALPRTWRRCSRLRPTTASSWPASRGRRTGLRFRGGC